MSERFTIVGARGYIGSRLAERLERAGEAVTRIDRFEAEAHADRELGHVIFAGGVTADFRERPFDTVAAHVTATADVLRHARFDSFLYLSSTRVYQAASGTGEDVTLSLDPSDPLQLYNATKLAGEALCLALPNDAIRVARISNVYGADDPSDNFLIDIVRAAITRHHVTFRTRLDSHKDFVSLDDVLDILPKIARAGRARLYNVASGRNTVYADLADGLRRVTGCSVDVAPDSMRVTFPVVSVARLEREFGFRPKRLSDEIEAFIEAYRSRHS
ncbi:MAG: NAD(P)-dependent oxidoreductase [Pseudomonadota bacterium]